MTEHTLQITDALTKEEALIIVRRVEGSTGLCVSLKTNGDAEVFLNSTELRRLIDTLKEFA